MSCRRLPADRRAERSAPKDPRMLRPSASLANEAARTMRPIETGRPGAGSSCYGTSSVATRSAGETTSNGRVIRSPGAPECDTSFQPDSTYLHTSKFRRSSIWLLLRSATDAGVYHNLLLRWAEV